MRRAWVLLLVLWTAMAGSVERRDPETHFFDQTFGDFSEELENAREQGKRGILIMFEMDECPFCHRMKSRVLNRKDVQDYFRKHFLVFTVDIEGDIEIVDFKGQPTTMKEFSFKRFRVRATPVFQFFDLDGNPIKRGRYTGATRDAQEFLLLGRYIVEEAWKRTSFSRYKRAHRER
ncbi:MAG TPA: thioredoxin [Chromatiaceae bacterium]|nr:thioredoxin [Chromatiaceae bacterium]